MQLQNNLFRLSVLLIFLISFFISSCNKDNPRVLIFNKTSGFYHNSIPDGIAAIQKLGSENGFEVDTTSNSEIFTEENLQKYAAVIFLNTTGDVLNHYQEADFERFIQAGGGFVGIHSAADTEYHWGWYGRLVGAYFLDHPPVQEGILHVQSKSHPSTKNLPEKWTRTDEWYNFKNFNEDVNVLITIDEKSYEGGSNMNSPPMAWYHEYDGGRAFYTALGHTSESYSEELFLDHLMGGIQYAIGNRKLDYSKVRTSRLPEENRFIKTELVSGGLFEPKEMAILPNLDILIAQRRGEILLYKNNDSTLSQVGFLDVYFETDAPNVNAEEGVIGIQADPDFEENQFIYIFYTPADTSVNRLSRFTFENDLVEMDSETVILEFYSTRDICCHTGGSLAFDNNGLLYASTGDNSTPFNQTGDGYVLDGYAPIDVRPGYEQYDARRTSGNSNDLRGKILRIKVNDDGSYDIPDGNLYPIGMENTRPEIYVQGTRNPYRISVDPKNNWLYWGDVGPDAANDSMGVRGPRGYDDINQAREAGHHGWPFFVGNNFAYNEYDFDTGAPGPIFDPDNPINRSPNNTGLRELPPAKPAFIWYPYSSSETFPEVGSGGRTSMAGPVYYTDLYSNENRYPDYYDGKLFIYDWIRDWIKVVTMDQNGDFDKMEPFMDNTTFNAIIDMEVGSDGRIYLLEYGKGWFSKNPDSGISRIDFNPGNRAPVVNQLSVNRSSGLTPLNIALEVDADDPDGDVLTFIWDLGTGEQIETSEPFLEYTFTEKGPYDITVTAKDPENLSDISDVLIVYAGNTAPIVHIDIIGNKTFYFPGKDIEYNVRIEHMGPDGYSEEIRENNLFVSVDYFDDTEIESDMPDGHQQISDLVLGESLVATLDCRACHHVEQQSVGPSYSEIAKRYHGQEDSQQYLMERIISGGSGVWGEVAMPAHLEITESDSRKIVSWILSLEGETSAAESLPASGFITSKQDEDVTNKTLQISASYTADGGEEVMALTGRNSFTLRNSTVNASAAQNLTGYQTFTMDENTFLISPSEEGSFSINSIDLTDIHQVKITSYSREYLQSIYTYELRLGDPNGQIIGTGLLPDSQIEAEDGIFTQLLTIDIESIDDGELQNLYFVSAPVEENETITPAISQIQFISK